jgi:hypothetical protein
MSLDGCEWEADAEHGLKFTISAGGCDFAGKDGEALLTAVVRHESQPLNRVSWVSRRRSYLDV